MWENLQQEKLEKSNIQTALCYVGANVHISANTSTWNFMYLFRNVAQAQCQPQLVMAVHLLPSGLKLFLHKTEQNTVVFIHMEYEYISIFYSYGIKELSNNISFCLLTSLRPECLKTLWKYLFFLIEVLAVLPVHIHFLTWPKAWSRLLPYVPLFNHKAAWKNILLLLFWISHLLYLLILPYSRKQKRSSYSSSLDFSLFSEHSDFQITFFHHVVPWFVSI